LDDLFIALTDLSGIGAYAVVFGILIACGLGLPLPEDIPMLASGYLCWEGTMEPYAAFANAMLGVLIGDSMLYYLGRRIGTGFLSRLFKPKRVLRVRAYFRKYGVGFVFFGRFMVGIRGLVFFTAGATRVKYSRFLLLDGLAALLSVPIWITLGWGLGHWYGEELNEILAALARFRNAALVITAVVIAIYAARWIVRLRKAKREA
jgi:membrane protein DedA with SNARE-associated domain